MKQSQKEWLFILGLFIITVLSLITSINQNVKAVIIIAIFIVVVILQFVVKVKNPPDNHK